VLTCAADAPTALAPPETIADTGLPFELIHELVVKTLDVAGGLTGA
jgi:hypothetical protein